MENTGKNPISHQYTWRKYWDMGRNVSVPAQNKALVLCCGNAAHSFCAACIGVLVYAINSLELIFSGYGWKKSKRVKMSLYTRRLCYEV